MLRLESSCCGWESASKECFGHMSEVKRGSWFSGILLVLKSVARCTCIFFFFKLLLPHGNLFTYCFIEFAPSACGFTEISCWVWVASQRQLRVQWTLTVPHAHSLSCCVDVLHIVNQKWMVKDYLAENHQVMFNFIFCMPDANIKRFFFHKYVLV